MACRGTLGAAALAVALAVASVFAEPLPSDPRIEYGTLANGVRWVFMRHAEPPGRVAMLAHVATGSLNEADDQRGIAHFISHMVFSGTEHFSAEELIKYYESIGAELSRDLSGYTSFDQTVYTLFLPDNTIPSVDRGLLTLSDYLFHATMDAEEVEKERKVIMTEWRGGRNAYERVLRKEVESVFAGSRIAERQVMGIPEVIEKVTRESLLDYYRTWYRPELTTVIIVGDTALGKIKPLLEERFGQYRAGIPAKKRFGAEFKFFSQPRAYVITDPELAGCEVGMIKVKPPRPHCTTVAQYRAELLEKVGTWLYGRRMGDRMGSGDSVSTEALAYVVDYYGGGVVAGAASYGDPANWRRMLEEMATEVVRVCQHGFTARELELAKRELIAAAEMKVETESARNAKSVLLSVSEATKNGEVVMSAEQELSLVRRLLPKVDLAEVNRIFRSHYQSPEFAFGVMLPAKSGAKVPTKAEVLQLAKATLEKKTAPLSDKKEPLKLLVTKLKPGKVAERIYNDRAGVTTVWLENNVCAHCKRLVHESDTVHITISLAGGRIEEDRSTVGFTQMCAFALTSFPATVRLSSSDLRDVMTGKKVSLDVSARDDRLVFSISGSKEHIVAGLQLAYSLLSEGVIEENALGQWKQQQHRRLAMLCNYPEYRAYEALAETLYAGDVRVRPLLQREWVDAAEVDKVQSWYDRLCRTAPIEVAVVGDLDEDSAIGMLQEYMGSLASRSRTSEHIAELRKIARPAGPFSRRIEMATVSPKAVVLAGFVGCDEGNPEEVRALDLASKILQGRVVRRIREELSLAYMLRVAHSPGVAYRQGGVFFIEVPCESDNADKVASEIHAVFETFAADGPGPRELLTAKKAAVRDLQEIVRTPDHWLKLLGDWQYHEHDIVDWLEQQDKYESISSKEILTVFRKYYSPVRRFTFIASPSSSASSGK